MSLKLDLVIFIIWIKQVLIINISVNQNNLTQGENDENLYHQQ